MTSAHLDDDAVSALLDGEATSEEAAHARRCDDCGERLGRFREAAARIGDVEPIDEVARERAVAAALEARVAPLRAGRWQQRPWLLGAAAVLLLALVVVPLLGDTGSDGDASLAGGDEVARDDATGAADESSGPETGSGAAESTLSLRAPGPVAVGHLGGVDGATLPALVRAALLGSGPSPTTAGDGAAPPEPGAPCEEAVRSRQPRLGDLRLTGTAEVGGRPGTVVVYDVIGSDPAELRAEIVTGADCETLLTSTFPAAE